MIGAGAMGCGIAQVFAAAGWNVRLFDVAAGAAVSGAATIARGFAEAVSRGKLSPAQAEEANSRVRVVEQLAEVAACELVIEAIIEDLDAKRALFRQLEAVVRPQTVLASNTSSLSIAAIARGLEHPERVIGMHFFHPVVAMKLVEIIVPTGSSPRVQRAAQAWVESLGKVGVLVTDSPGFLVNLAGRALATEALAITRDGIASFAEVDRVAREVVGFPLGPFELMDRTGIDVNFPVTSNLFTQNFGDPKLRSTWEHSYLFESGRHGRKSGLGFFDYRGGESGGETTFAPHAEVSVEPSQPVAAEAQTPSVYCAGSEALNEFVAEHGFACAPMSAADFILVDPLGKDLCSVAAESGLDPRRLVGVDTLFADAAVCTVMVLPGINDERFRQLCASIARKRAVVVINDSPGFVAQRLVAAVINLGCEIALRGIAEPEDIDVAVRLGLRYPLGPLEWCDVIGADRVYEILRGLRHATGDQRYQPSAWLRQRVITGLSCRTVSVSSKK